MGFGGRALAASCVILGCLTASPAGALSRDSHLALAEIAGEHAPPDLARQIERHEKQLREGVLAARASPATGRPISEVVREQVEGAVRAIEGHRPFAEIVHRLGAVAYYVALANDPLLVADGDPAEPRYRADFPVYLDSASPRFTVAFYGEGRDLQTSGDLDAMIANAFARGRSVYPAIGREYRRIEFGQGRRLFDDRSTAFGVAALVYSHAVSDIVGALRYIWIRSGGVDRRLLPRLSRP